VQAPVVGAARWKLFSTSDGAGIGCSHALSSGSRPRRL
jgi:hypothetical protein